MTAIIRSATSAGLRRLALAGICVLAIMLAGSVFGYLGLAQARVNWDQYRQCMAQVFKPGYLPPNAAVCCVQAGGVWDTDQGCREPAPVNAPPPGAQAPTPMAPVQTQIMVPNQGGQ